MSVPATETLDRLGTVVIVTVIPEVVTSIVLSDESVVVMEKEPVVRVERGFRTAATVNVSTPAVNSLVNPFVMSSEELVGLQVKEDV